MIKGSPRDWFRRGWVDGATIANLQPLDGVEPESYQGHDPYSRGCAAGYRAFRGAMADEGVVLGLPSPEQLEPLLGLAWGVAHNAGMRSPVRRVRWAHVMDVTGLGSTSAAKLCRDHGVDPDEEIGGES